MSTLSILARLSILSKIKGVKMEGENICSLCGKTFKTAQGLRGHIMFKHPDESNREAPEKPKEELPEAPLTEVAFASLLQTFKLRADLARNIAVNVSHTGGPNVFENPRLLLERLSLWSKEITPNMRKLIIEQWFAERGIDIPAEVQQKAGMTTDQIAKTEAETKTGGEVRYVWDVESRQIRMARESERGGTLAQAKELKKMVEEDDKVGTESPFVQDKDGHWGLNPKARVTGVELMAVQFMQQSQDKGEPLDPIEAMTKAAETWKTLREGLGVGGSTLPTWMTDPVALVTAIKAITGGGGGDSAAKAELAEIRKALDDMKDERWREMFAGQQKQIQDIASVLNKALETVADMQKGRTGRTEMDILHEIAEKGIDLAKTELPGLRRDIKEAVGSVSLPPGKSPEDREKRKQKYKQAVDADRDIEEIGRRLFLPEG